MAFLLLALLVKRLLPITHPPLSSFINNSARAQVKVMTAKLYGISSSSQDQSATSLEIGITFPKVTRLNWHSFLCLTPRVFLSHPTPPSLRRDIFGSVFSPKTPVVPGCESQQIGRQGECSLISTSRGK